MKTRKLSIRYAALLLSLLVSCICTLLIAADEPTVLKRRVVGPFRTYSEQDLVDFSPEWIQVKFAEGTDVVSQPNPRTRKKLFVDKLGGDLKAVNFVVETALEIEPTFPGDRERFKRYKSLGEQHSGTVGPDLGLWYNVRFPGDRANLAERLNELNDLDVIEIAHGVPRVEDAVVFSPAAPVAPLSAGPTPDYSSLQGYLFDPPRGLNASPAWVLPGGLGENAKFIDVERGWYHEHEDFRQSTFFFNGSTSNPADPPFDHGTAVLGEIIGADNGAGVLGFASSSNWGTVAYRTGDHPLVAEYFLEAAEALEPGDIWLIEIQMFPSGFDATPMEYLQANFDVIWTSSYSMNVVCVEAGANGTENLDRTEYEGLFDRRIRDSGAILVAAGTPTTLEAEWFTNYGSRMDLNAWGSSIVTTGYGDLQSGANEQEYTAVFGGTSGASPMVVGAGLLVQSIYKQQTGSILRPLNLRQLLVENGSPHNSTGREIGPRPDIGRTIQNLPMPVSVPPSEFQVTLGDLARGSVSDLETSDNLDLSVRRGAGSIQAGTWLEMTATSPSTTPIDLTFTVEASVFARTPIVQQIELFDYDRERFERLDSRNAARFNDAIVEVRPTGDLSRFVESSNSKLRARIRFDSISPRQGFTSNVDHAFWTITN